MLSSVTLQAGVPVRFNELANYFRLLKATAEVNIDFYLRGKEVADAYGVTGGYAEQFDGGFDSFEIVSATTQTVQFASRVGSKVFYDAPPSGNVVVQSGSIAVSSLAPSRSAGPTQTTKTVGVASGVLVAANAARSYLLLQNRHATAKLYLNLAGAAAVVADGIYIPPGGSYELNCNVLTGEIRAISDTAGTSVIVVEG